MAGIIGNYIFAYGFVTDISKRRYFKDSTIDSDMDAIKIKKRWRRFLNEVGWYQWAFVELKEQSKLYVFGERIRSVEDRTFIYNDEYNDEPDKAIMYDIEEDIFNAKIKYRKIIDEEAERNGTSATFLLLMNDKFGDI